MKEFVGFPHPLICLACFLLYQTKMLNLKSLRNRLTEAGFNNALQLFHFLDQAHITFEFGPFTLHQNVDPFGLCWAMEEAVCKVEDGQLVLNLQAHEGC